MVVIESPVKGYTGISAGVGFALGKALVRELTPTQEAYFRKKGYVINKEEENNSSNSEVTQTTNLTSNSEVSGPNPYADLEDIE